MQYHPAVPIIRLWLLLAAALAVYLCWPSSDLAVVVPMMLLQSSCCCSVGVTCLTSCTGNTASSQMSVVLADVIDNAGDGVTCANCPDFNGTWVLDSTPSPTLGGATPSCSGGGSDCHWEYRDDGSDEICAGRGNGMGIVLSFCVYSFSTNRDLTMIVRDGAGYVRSDLWQESFASSEDCTAFSSKALPALGGIGVCLSPTDALVTSL